MRLDRYLSQCGFGSRETVKKLLRSGRVKLSSGETAEAAHSMSEGEAVFVDGERVLFSEHEYIMLHKPAGYVTARKDATSPVVKDLVPELRRDASPVGRLDKDTEGLLLFTNDGALLHALLSPKREVGKTYYFRTETKIPEEAEEILSKPVVFQDFTSKPAVFHRISDLEGTLTVTEGKYHEVKRLMHHAGADVVYLKRISFAGLSLGELPRGAWRALTADEVAALKNLAKRSVS